MILREEKAVSLSVDAPPVSENMGRLAPIHPGFGTAKPIERNICCDCPQLDYQVLLRALVVIFLLRLGEDLLLWPHHLIILLLVLLVIS